MDEHELMMDLSFDFEAYFERSKNDTLTKEERDEFTGRVMAFFCRSVWSDVETTVNTVAIPFWVANYLAEALYKVLAGEEWEHALPLPWTTETPIRTRAGQLALDMFCEIANALKEDDSLTVTGAMESIARKHNVSFETARSAYYKHKKHLPKDFLKNSSKN